MLHEPSALGNREFDAQLGRGDRGQRRIVCSLHVDELVPSSGVVKVVFCFDNGVFTGNGNGVGFRHAMEVPYRFEENVYRVGDDGVREL